jgi:glycosyl transferase family 87
MTNARRADLAYWIAVAAGVLFVIFGGPLERRLELVHMNDFSGVWSGARAIVLGVNPWDPSQYYGFAVEVGTKTPDALVYDYMPWVAFAVAPLAMVTLETAGWIWMFLSMSCAALALRGLLRAFVPGRAVTHAAFGTALFIAQPAFHAIVLGQWSLLLMSAVAATVLALRASRPLLAALPSLLFLAKPQLVVFTALGLAYGALREPVFRRYVIIALLLAAAVVTVAWLAAPPEWFPAWLDDIPPRRTIRSAVLPSVLNQLIGANGRYVAYALIGLGAVLAARFRPGSDASLAAWLSLSSAGAIYSWSYDQVLLLVPAVITAGILTRRSERAGRRFALAASGTLLVVSPVLYGIAVLRRDETFSALIPIGFFIAIVVLLWREGMRAGDVVAPVERAA